MMKKGNRRIRHKARFFTNDFRLSASMIDNIYKSRCQVESFFKIICQSLKIKSFMVTSTDAVKTQIYEALSAVPILRHPQVSLKIQWCVPHMLAMIHLILHPPWKLVRLA
jgi:putative transposase